MQRRPTRIDEYSSGLPPASPHYPSFPDRATRCLLKQLESRLRVPRPAAVPPAPPRAMPEYAGCPPARCRQPTVLERLSVPTLSRTDEHAWTHGPYPPARETPGRPADASTSDTTARCRQRDRSVLPSPSTERRTLRPASESTRLTTNNRARLPLIGAGGPAQELYCYRLPRNRPSRAVGA